jgi:uroporphyrinogen decarboxylase
MNSCCMTPKECLISAVSNCKPDRTPTFEWFIDERVGEALTGSRDPVEIVEALDIDGINVRATYLQSREEGDTYTDEWGAKRRLTGDCIAAVTHSPIPDIAGHSGYRFPDPHAPHRFASLEKAVERFGDRRAVVLNLRDGWSDMRDLLGYEEAMVQLMLEPGHFADLLNRSVDYNLELAAIARQRYDLDIVATTDDIAFASGLLLPLPQYLDVIGPAFRRVIQGYKELGYLVVKHCDGNINDVIDFWIECGIDCIDPIDPAGGMTLAEAVRRYGSRIAVKGNVDCKGALCSGTPEDVAAEVRACIEVAGGSGYVLSSSNTIHRGVRPENYRAMLDALRKYG